MAGECGGIDEITEHDRELPTFRVRRRCSRTGFNQRGGLFLGSRLWCWLNRLRGDCLGNGSITRPHEHLPVLISGELVDFDEFILQDVEGGVIQVELELESPVRGFPSLLEQGNHAVEYRVEVHYRPSSSSCNNALASLRSAVSNPSVNQLYTSANTCHASSRFPCCCHNRARLVAVRNSKDLAC